jgi:hypothetical protein
MICKNHKVILTSVVFLLAFSGGACSQQDSDDGHDRRKNQTLSTSLSRTMFEVQEALLN